MQIILYKAGSFHEGSTEKLVGHADTDQLESNRRYDVRVHIERGGSRFSLTVFNQPQQKIQEKIERMAETYAIIEEVDVSPVLTANECFRLQMESILR